MANEQERVGRALAGMAPSSMIPTNPSISERLEGEAAILRARLVDVEAALDALRNNPEVEQIINLVSKVQHGSY